MKALRLNIGRRMALLCAGMLAVMIGLTAYSVFALKTAGERFQRLKSENMAKERIAVEWQGLASAGRQRTYAILKSTDQELAERMSKLTAEGTAAATAASAKLDKLQKTPREQELYEAVNKARKVYLASRDEVAKLKKAGENDKAAELFATKFDPQSMAYMAAIGSFVDELQTDVDNLTKQMDADIERTRNVLMTLTVIGAIVSILLGLWIARSITRPIRSAVDAAEALAQGDLTPRKHEIRRDETGQLLTALDNTASRLASIVMGIRSGSGAISNASQEIAAGNADLSHRTEEQASSLQETAASMEELAGTVKQNAENAKHANELAAAASSVAEKGGEVVSEVVATMSSINDSSTKIADIIGVIDGIAFQTNILALNAAVEAARAGEQGRGFAVVASEVRSLAQRSAAAAKEIKELISDSVSKVENGTRLVDRAGKTMEEVVSSVKQVTGIVGEIASATGEQSSGIEQVNHAITQMDQVTQQNAALVEQAAAAAESMKEQAAGLETRVAVFKVADDVQRAEIAAPVVERRGPNRATNVKRLPARVPAAARAQARTESKKTGTTDDWSEF